MATSITPKVRGPDGVLREEFIFSTTLLSRFFIGTVDPSTVDMEVSIRGGAYTNSTDLVSFDGTNWVIPNPAAFPDGLDLVVGGNVVLIRAITTSGSVSSPASVTVRLIQESDLGIITTTPTNVSVEQKDSTVVLTVDGVEDDNFQGINFYASKYEGGGVTGYTRVNVSTLTTGFTEEDISDLDSFEAEAVILTNPDGTHAADPMFVQYIGQQVDADGIVFQSDFDQRFEIPETISRIRTSLSLQSIRLVTRYSFEHSRSGTATSNPATVFMGTFASTPSADPLYYVCTAIYYDPSTLIESESSFSAEVVAHPLMVSTSVGTFPIVRRETIVRDTIASIFRTNPQVKVEPGAFVRDIFIDPFSAEATRLRFIIDFLHRAQSFAGLISIDDPSGTGNSDSVASSTYKQALKSAFQLTRNSDVQALIDRAFESLAANYGKFRNPGRFARGEVTFFTSKRPTQSIPIPIGSTVSGGSIEFKVLTGTVLPFERLASFFIPTTGRYQITVSIQAAVVGSAGNVAVGQIRKVTSGVTGLSVINASSMFGGSDQETNQELAERAMNALASVDSGTARGYLQTAAGVPGVIQAEVISAGDAMMRRDLDSDGVHRGGKVDIWIQGENLATVTDIFAFARDIARDIHFVVIGDPLNLTFRAIDSTLSQGTPIVEMLDNPVLDLGLRNATTGLDFDLTNVQIVSFDTITLDTSLVQPPVSLSDVVLGDYRRQTGNTFVLPRQPVREITSVEGTLSGVLPIATYRLVHPKDPLGEGLSQLAGDYIEITPVNGVPAGGSVTVTDEPHVLIGEYLEYLDSIGVNSLSIVVKSEDLAITYRGPDDPSGIADYTIVDGNETTAAAIKRIPSGDIVSGQTVLVSYEHDENFTITYKSNAIVGVVQDAVKVKRHVTADVLVKEAAEVPVDITATVILTRGAVQSTADSNIRTNLSNLFASFRLGAPVRQGDIVAVIENTSGVSYVEVPLTKMVRGEGSTVVTESLTTGQTGDSTYISTWSTTSVSVWLLEDSLNSATTDGGGPAGDFRGVFQDDIAMISLGTLSGTALGAASGRAFTIGSNGASIPGFSDDVTLIAQGYVTAEEIVTQRKVLTADRVLVSTGVDDAPTNHAYTVTYIVGAGTGSNNISTSSAEYLVLGNLDLTFDEDR